jgi:beta-lactamase class A
MKTLVSPSRAAGDGDGGSGHAIGYTGTPLAVETFDPLDPATRAGTGPAGGHCLPSGRGRGRGSNFANEEAPDINRVQMTEAVLRDTIRELAEDAGAAAVAVAVHDFEHEMSWRLDGERWFHAASTIKVPVLLGVFDAIEDGRLQPYSRIHVRNRFASAADGRPFRVQSGRDANADVHAARGRMMTVRELSAHMIVTSSNLATNLLLDVVGVEAVQSTLDRLGLQGIELHRGVEDEAAWEQGLNNRITADGLCAALRAIEERKAISVQACDAMLGILHQQRFRSGIPAGLPDDARVANKTGEMSTAAHDGGIVYLEGRKPYVVVILTEWQSETNGRRNLIARISRAIYEHVAEGDVDG